MVKYTQTILILCKFIILTNTLELSDKNNVDTVSSYSDSNSLLQIQSDSILKALTSLLGLKAPQPLPELPQDTCWGDDCSQDESIRPFKVQFQDGMIKDLRGRLASRRPLLPSLYNSSHTYGINTQTLEQILNYWTYDYDFNAREQHLNTLPQYKTKIQGLDIHYIHAKPTTEKRILPILLIHGSPVTAFEYQNTTTLLQTANGDFDFDLEVIAPDLPGYGYSQSTNKKGLTSYQIAIIMKNLMERLGHKKFFVHAGDIGHFVSIALCALYPDDILGYHTNLPVSIMPITFIKEIIGESFPTAVVAPEYEDRLYPLSEHGKSLLSNTAYIHVHATRPDQVGIGLDESPVALAAWLLQLFIVGAEDGDKNLDELDSLQRNYNIEDILDSFTIYWDQRCATTSARLYAGTYNLFDPVQQTILLSKTEVPFAALNFKTEILYQPDEFLKDTFPNLVQSRTLDHGGHFAGFINPEDLDDSIRNAVAKMDKFNAEKATTSVVSGSEDNE